jgi:hypothetical protein
LRALLGERCGEIREEPFTISPDSLFAIGKIFAVAYLVGAASILIDSSASLCVGHYDSAPIYPFYERVLPRSRMRARE